jgi:hypothetical protein
MDVRRAFTRQAADLARVFGDRFVAFVACSPEASLAFATRIAAGDLTACGVLADTWHREGLAAPMLVTPDEFRRSLDAFPLEYQAILDRHEIIAGRSPFDGCRIAPEDLRRACEAQTRSHLFRLRQGWMDAGDHPAELAEVMRDSAAPLRVLLTNLARLRGGAADTADDLAAFAGREAGMSIDLVRAVLDLETRPDRAPALAVRLPEYLESLERLWQFVDGWRASTS